jgi:hypothetical protein
MSDDLPEKRGQIAHLDEAPSNFARSHLAPGDGDGSAAVVGGYSDDDDRGGGSVGDGTKPCIARRRELVCTSLKRRELCPNLAVQHGDSLATIFLWRDI